MSINPGKNINAICNSMLAVPSLSELIRLGRLQSIAMPNVRTDAFDYLRNLATQCSVPFYVLSKENLGDDLMQWLKMYPCKVVLSFTFPYKISESVFSIPEYGFVNFHFALLPEYRGAEPVFWMFRNKETLGGVTIHQMDRNWDTGPILIRSEMKIEQEDTHALYLSKIAIHATSQILPLLKILDEGSFLSTLKIQHMGKTYSKPGYSDVKIDWNRHHAKDVIAIVKACNSWNRGAITILNGVEVRIVEAVAIDTFYDIKSNVAGSVALSPDKNSFAISSVDGRFVLPEIFSLNEGFFSPRTLIKMGVNQNFKFN